MLAVVLVSPLVCGSVVLLGDRELELRTEECDGEGVLAGVRPALGDLSLPIKALNLSLVLDLDRPTEAPGSISGSDPDALED